jgi:hypothetical protein
MEDLDDQELDMRSNPSEDDEVGSDNEQDGEQPSDEEEEDEDEEDDQDVREDRKAVPEAAPRKVLPTRSTTDDLGRVLEARGRGDVEAALAATEDVRRIVNVALVALSERSSGGKPAMIDSLRYASSLKTVAGCEMVSAMRFDKDGGAYPVTFRLQGSKGVAEAVVAVTRFADVIHGVHADYADNTTVYDSAATPDSLTEEFTEALEALYALKVATSGCVKVYAA